eukprot:m.1291056 g.1291056  ORF g.1291056 m.1291056 type:complete len:468 (+) comp24784_c0_seq40:655-2058(+)
MTSTVTSRPNRLCTMGSARTGRMQGCTCVTAMGLIMGMALGVLVGVRVAQNNFVSDKTPYQYSNTRRSLDEQRILVGNAVAVAGHPLTGRSASAMGSASDSPQHEKLQQRAHEVSAQSQKSDELSIPSSDITEALAEKHPGCRAALAPSGEPSRFDIVLLATYPRSGNSWTRSLLRTATELKSDLTTAKGLHTLSQLAASANCTTCPQIQVRKLLTQLGIGWATNTLKQRPLYGIQGAEAASENMPCLDKYSTEVERTSTPWPSFPQIPPLIVKTHYPQIGDTKVEEFTHNVHKKIHIIRNPFDNIASRFLGNQRQHEDRFNALVEARKDGKTTQDFTKFLNLEIDRLKDFHNYWSERRLSDAERGVQTLFVRYEVLCLNTTRVFKRMLDFAGFNAKPNLLQCTLDSLQCHSSTVPFPVHIDLFTEKQIQLVLKENQKILQMYGYTWQQGHLEMEDNDVTCDASIEE